MTNPSRLLALALAAVLSAPISWAAGSRSAPRLPGTTRVAAPQVGLEGLNVRPIEGLAPSIPSVGTRLTVPTVALESAIVRPSAIVNPALARPMIGTIVEAPIIRAAGAQIGVAPVVSNVNALSEQMESVHRALEANHDGGAPGLELDKIYFGKRDQRRAVQASGGSQTQGRARKDPSQGAVFVVNDEGVAINGRAADYYKESKRLEAKYQGRVDMTESLGVMDDSYADVYAKLQTIEAVAASRQITQENTHLEQTLLFVDGVLEDGDRRIAVNTHRVYFHHAPEGPGKARSEINEGIRRVNGYLEEMSGYFKRGGKAEQALGELDEVVLGFDARGYDEIKEHLKGKEAEFAAKIGKPVKFAFLDDLAPVPSDKTAVRSELNRLVKKYKGQGLSKIIEGVVYSRYVGLLLELKTIEHYYEKGYKILQGGRELFDANGHYITELDVVVQAPDGRIFVVEAKSARVSIPVEQALEDKVTYKLDTYFKHLPDMERAIGGRMAEVVFAFDVGNNYELAEYLKSQEEALSERYGRPISFVFLDSSPVSETDTRTSEQRARQKIAEARQTAEWREGEGGNGRKHGRKGRRR